MLQGPGMIPVWKLSMAVGWHEEILHDPHSMGLECTGCSIQGQTPSESEYCQNTVAAPTGFWARQPELPWTSYVLYSNTPNQIRSRKSFDPVL